MAKVLIIGDSRKMKGGVSTVIKTWETTFIWQKYRCHWVQCQINSGAVLKLLYLLRGYMEALIRMPFYDIVFFHTAVGRSILVQKPMFLYAQVLRKKIVTELHVGNQIAEHLNESFFQHCINSSSLVITLGKQWRDLLASQGWVHTPVDYLYNPSPKVSAPVSPKKYFLFAAYFDKNKGYETLIKAFASILRLYPEWRLVLCGTGDVEGVRSTIASSGLDSTAVEMTGWVTGEVKQRLFKEAYAYCMASEKEGLPMSVLESMAWGIPVISTRVGCLPEILTDRESALFFNYGDSDELTQRMAELIDDTRLRLSIINNAQDIIAKEFDPGIISAKLDHILKKL